MADLTILCPSRGRPKNAVQMYESFRETCTADTKLLILVDANDPTLSTYYTLLNGVGQVLVVEPNRRGMVEALQRGLEDYRDNLGYAVGFMGDDHRPRTHGWDSAYLEALRGLGNGFVYGNDLYQGEAIPTQIAMTTDIVDALGYMCPPGFDHLCVDVVWNDWGRAIGKIEYLDEVIIEHLHYLAGKSKFDKGYAAVNNAEVAGHDNDEYKRYHESGEFDADVEKLKALIAPKLVTPSEEVVDKPYVANPTKKRPGRPKKAEVDAVEDNSDA